MGQAGVWLELRAVRDLGRGQFYMDFKDRASRSGVGDELGMG